MEKQGKARPSWQNYAIIFMLLALSYRFIFDRTVPASLLLAASFTVLMVGIDEVIYRYRTRREK